MNRKWMVAIPLFAILAWAAGTQQDAKTVISSATKALGADNLKTVEFSGSGFDYAIGQAPNPSLPWPKFNDKTYNRVVDLDAPASRMQRIRTQCENPPHGGGQQPIIGEQKQDQVVAAGSPQAGALRDELMMTLPYSFLRSAAAASDASVKSQTMGGKKYTVLSFTGSNKAAVRGYLNSDNLVERVETKIDNNVLGDMPFETAFSDYKDFGGVKFPTHIVQKQGGYPVLDLTITDVKPNAPANIRERACAASAGAASGIVGKTERWRVSDPGRLCGAGGGFQRLHRDRRRRAERSAQRSGDGGSQETDSEQAHQVRNQHPPAFRPLRRPARLCGGGRHRGHAPDQQAVLRKDLGEPAHDCPGQAVEESQEAEVRDGGRQEGHDRRQSRHRAVSSAEFRP